MTQTIMGVRGKHSKPGCPTIRVSTVFNNGLVTKFLDLQQSEVANLYEDRPASPSILIKRAMSFYADYVKTLKTEEAITKERIAILKNVG